LKFIQYYEFMSSTQFFTYLTYGTRDEAWKIYGTKVGYLHIEPGEYQQGNLPWSHEQLPTDFQCIYITEGTGYFTVEDTKHRVFPGTILTLVPGQHYSYGPESDSGWTEYIVGFQGEYPQELQRLGYFPPESLVRDVGLRDSLVGICTEIMEIAKEQRSGYQHLIGSQIMVLLAKIDYQTQQGAQMQGYELELIEQIKAKFQQHIYATLDIETLAGSMNISYAMLRDIFKKYSGLSPYQYFLQMKINKAKELLSEGNLTVKEVSFKLAFDNPYYFSRFFKKKTGVSPSKWNGKEIPTDLDFPT